LTGRRAGTTSLPASGVTFRSAAQGEDKREKRAGKP
jgi:hypothetical protein